ncbi:hypothetical protein [Streptomyces sp. NPDC006668]|uniref:hypothetical protein n=1 Tax=Streptomyces sp. NPDC006668 TaxID=3156903 RepID=UPI0033E1A056
MINLMRVQSTVEIERDPCRHAEVSQCLARVQDLLFDERIEITIVGGARRSQRFLRGSLKFFEPPLSARKEIDHRIGAQEVQLRKAGETTLCQSLSPTTESSKTVRRAIPPSTATVRNQRQMLGQQFDASRIRLTAELFAPHPPLIR